MNDGPLAAFPYPDGYRLHDPAAVRFPVARLYVHMEVGKTVRTMISVAATGIFWCHESAADLACEGVIADMSFVVTFFIHFSLIFTIQDRSS